MKITDIKTFLMETGGRDWVFGEIGAICQRVESSPESHGLYNQRDVCKRSLSQTVKGRRARAIGIGALAASGFRWFDFKRGI